VSTNVSHVLAVSFFSLEICIPYTCQVHVTPPHGLIDWMCQVYVDAKHYMWYVCGQSTYIVLWCGLGLRNVFLTYGWLH
jgi:hypothetical protein